MNTERFDTIITRWENGETPSPDDVRALEQACAADVRVARRYGKILPFIRRDAGLESADESPLRPNGAAEPRSQLVEIADLVMESIAESGHLPRRRHRISLPVAAAAVIAIALVGIGAIASTLFFSPTQQPIAHDSPSDTVTVRFSLVAPEARSVSIVGDFNDWAPGLHVLAEPDSDGVWWIEIPLLKGDTYTYNFLIDDEVWIPDPRAERTIRDPFGTKKSVLNL